MIFLIETRHGVFFLSVYLHCLTVYRYEAARLPAKEFLDVELLALKELSWSLEISALEWNKWLHYLRTANISLERTRPTTENYHFVLARLLQDAIIATGDKDEIAIWKRGRQRNRLTAVGVGLWDSYEGASTANEVEGPFGLYALQQKLDRMNQSVREVAIPSEAVPLKFIPWDTSLDPVVHVQPRARSGSGTGGEVEQRRNRVGGSAGLDGLAGRRSLHIKNNAQLGNAFALCNGPIGFGRGPGVVGDSWQAHF